MASSAVLASKFDCFRWSQIEHLSFIKESSPASSMRRASPFAHPLSSPSAGLHGGNFNIEFCGGCYCGGHCWSWTCQCGSLTDAVVKYRCRTISNIHVVLFYCIQCALALDILIRQPAASSLCTSRPCSWSSWSRNRRLGSQLVTASPTTKQESVTRLQGHTHDLLCCRRDHLRPEALADVDRTPFSLARVHL